MTRSIAIHWDQDFIRIATADVGQRVRVDEIVAFPVGDGSDLTPIAENIAKYVAKLGLARAEASVVIGRGQIEFRVFELPNAPDDELPDLVRYQAKNQFSGLPEGQPIDFVRLGNVKEGLPIHVLAATLNNAELKRIQTALEPAKIRVRHLLPRPFAVVNLLRDELNTPKHVLLINRFDGEADLTVTYRNQIILTRTVRLPHDEADVAAALVLEVRRTIAAASNQPSSGQVTRVLILGNRISHQTIAAAIEEQLKLPAEARSIEEFISLSSSAAKAIADDDGSFAPVFGSFGLPAEPSEHLIDFAIPRKRPEPVKDPRKKYRIAAIAGAVALLVFGTAFFVIGQRRSAISRLTSELSSLNANSEARDLLIGKVDTIDRWKRGDINWLEELYEISERFPVPDDAIANRWSASVATASDEATINISGLISEPRIENELVEQLRDRPFKVAQGKTGPVTDNKLFKRSFDVRLGLPLSPRNIDQLLQLGAKPSAEPPAAPQTPVQPQTNTANPETP